MSTLDSQQQPPPHPLEALEESTQKDETTNLPTPDSKQDREWDNLSPQARASALAQDELCWDYDVTVA